MSAEARHQNLHLTVRPRLARNDFKCAAYPFLKARKAGRQTSAQPGNVLGYFHAVPSGLLRAPVRYPASLPVVLGQCCRCCPN